jgi:hypothetical protein
MKTRSGSVLLEFLLVLPVYLALIGGTFAVGRLLLVGIRLSQADRAWAMCPDEFRGAARAALSALLPLELYEYDDMMCTVASDGLVYSDNTLRAEESFQGAWSLLSAAKVNDLCHHPPWTRGWFGFAADLFSDFISEKSEVSKDGMNTDMTAFLANMVSVTAMETERKYNYYTLKRTVVGRTSYRTWEPQNLINVPVDFGSLTVSDALPVWGSVWFKYIYTEPFPETRSSVLDDSSQEEDSVPDEPSWRTDYSRFPSYLLWSQ